MNSHRNLVIFALLLACVGAAKSDCSSNLHVTKSDWENLEKDSANPPEAILCMYKCYYEQQRAFNEDKTVKLDKLLKGVEVRKTLDDVTREELKECVKRDGIPVNECADIKPYFLCILKAQIKQVKTESS
ncbi:uncharacterized protein LOC123318952 [Coccinella septempunctata]|uniref:uncharacterized protein LOC123318952 n=1 Tax=Coccinella septempunctata TaxID=41139 RepID=UPI001D097C09|nr:uncharacterized protein LOC123318952 [Coccinella septempunctata]